MHSQQDREDGQEACSSGGTGSNAETGRDGSGQERSSDAAAFNRTFFRPSCRVWVGKGSVVKVMESSDPRVSDVRHSEHSDSNQTWKRSDEKIGGHPAHGPKKRRNRNDLIQVSNKIVPYSNIKTRPGAHLYSHPCLKPGELIVWATARVGPTPR